MDYLSNKELWQRNRQYLQNMLCAQAPYAPGANTASMDYDVDELDKIPSGVGSFDKICRCGHQIKVCPAVAFPCYLEKRSETRTRRVQCARCDVGRLSWYLLCSIPAVTSNHQSVSFIPAEHAAFRKSS